MAGSTERDEARRGSVMGAFISGRLPQKLSDSLFPGPDRALKPSAVGRLRRKRRLFPSLSAFLHPIAPLVRNRLETQKMGCE
jgi:hypothetical protein